MCKFRAKHAEYAALAMHAHASTALGKRFLNFYAVLTASIGIKRMGVAADQIYLMNKNEMIWRIQVC